MSEINYYNTDPKFVQAKYFRKGRIKPVELIVIHTMEAPEKGETAENIANYFKTIDRPASAHYCIDENSIVQCVYDSDTAYHCKNANANGMGLEHAGYAKQTAEDWADEKSIAILKNSAQIAGYLCNKFNIPVRMAKFTDSGYVLERGFCGHADVPNHGSHYDPGVNFPWGLYLEMVQEVLDKNK